MLEYIIPLLASFMPLFQYALWQIFALCFLCAVPVILTAFFRR